MRTTVVDYAKLKHFGGLSQLHCHLFVHFTSCVASYLSIVYLQFEFGAGVHAKISILLIFIAPKMPHGKEGHVPAHQNRTAFKHNPKSKKTDKILSIPASSGCCKHCTDVIEWKRNYRSVVVCATGVTSESRRPGLFCCFSCSRSL